MRKAEVNPVHLNEGPQETRVEDQVESLLKKIQPTRLADQRRRSVAQHGKCLKGELKVVPWAPLREKGQGVFGFSPGPSQDAGVPNPCASPRACVILLVLVGKHYWLESPTLSSFYPLGRSRHGMASWNTLC